MRNNEDFSDEPDAEALREDTIAMLEIAKAAGVKAKPEGPATTGEIRCMERVLGTADQQLSAVRRGTLRYDDFIANMAGLELGGCPVGFGRLFAEWSHTLEDFLRIREDRSPTHQRDFEDASEAMEQYATNAGARWR